MEKYRYEDVRNAGSRFYPDEAYWDGSTEFPHENANVCDTCDEGAYWMTFIMFDGSPDLDYAVYCCDKCVTKYGLRDLCDDDSENKARG